MDVSLLIVVCSWLNLTCYSYAKIIFIKQKQKDVVQKMKEVRVFIIMVIISARKLGYPNSEVIRTIQDWCEL